jgi:hypothetical protein
MPWLGVGELLNLAAGWAPDDADAERGRGRPSTARSVRARSADAAGRSVAWHGRYAWGAPEEGGEPVAGAGRSRDGDRRRKQWVAAGAGDQHRGYRQQVDGQGARDGLALPARPGYVPPVDGDLEGCRSGHDAGRQGSRRCRRPGAGGRGRSRHQATGRRDRGTRGRGQPPGPRPPRRGPGQRVRQFTLVGLRQAKQQRRARLSAGPKPTAPGHILTQPNGSHNMATVRLLLIGGRHGFS